MEVTINHNSQTFKTYSINLIIIDENHKYFLSLPDKSSKKPSIYLVFSSDYQNSSDLEKARATIDEISDSIPKTDEPPILAMPLIPYDTLKEAASTNDYHQYQLIFGNLHAITIDINQKISNQNLGITLDQIITLVTQNDIDKSLADWLAMSFGSEYFKIISLPSKTQNASPEPHIAPIIQEPYYDSGDNGNSGLNLNGAKSNETIKILKKVPPSTAAHHGFSSFAFIILTLALSLIVGISFAIFLIK